MIDKSLIDKYLRCPKCLGSLIVDDSQIFCKECLSLYNFIDHDIPSLMTNISQDTKLSMIKWDDIYSDKKYREDLEREYKSTFLDSAVAQLNNYVKIIQTEKPHVFLELGSGSAFIGEYYACRDWFFIGIDFSPNSLIYLKRRLLSRNITNFLLIHGEIQNLPLKDNTVDFIFGGGVLEHFKDTQLAVDNLQRVSKKGGIAVNVVPRLNLGSILYRSRWGSIPNFPVLKQLAEFVHIKLLKSKHMIFGYELQFSNSQLRSLHKKAGYISKNISVITFITPIQFNNIPHEFIKNMLKALVSKCSWFQPAWVVIARK